MQTLSSITYDIYEASRFDQPADTPPDAPQDNASSPDFSKLKKYTLFLKLKELKSYLDLYISNLGDDEAKKEEIDKIVYFINIVLNFFDIFDFETVKTLSNEVLDTVEQVVKPKAAVTKPA